MRKLRVVLGACLAAGGLLAVPVLAESLPAGVPDLIGARGLALGAYRGLLTGNDGMFTNAASLAAAARYQVEAQWLYDRLSDGHEPIQAFTLSAVDSTSSSFTGGVGYSRVVSGAYTGNLFLVPLAFPVSDAMFMGLTGKYLSMDGQDALAGDSIQAGNVDASLYVRVAQVGFGVSGYNLLASGHHLVMPRGIGSGVSFGGEGKYLLAVDWRGDFDTRGHLTSLIAVGGEYSVADTLALRASYLKDDTRDASFWSAGVGVAISSQFAVDLSYRQNFEQPSEYTVAAGIRIYLNTM